MPDSPLLAFYRGGGTDHAGRRLDEILLWGHDRLEWTHDYIQWLFPLKEASAFNPWAPILVPEDIAAFHADAGLRERLRQSLRLMLDFYGLACDDRDAAHVVIRPAGHFAERSREWLTPGNHNFLRLTRILKCLSLLGLGNHAHALLDCLEECYRDAWRTIGESTMGYWQRAVA